MEHKQEYINTKNEMTDDNISNSLDVIHNKQHKEMFNKFIKNIYEITLTDYTNLMNESHTLQQKQSIQKRFSEDISDSSLCFYKQIMNVLHSNISHKNAKITNKNNFNINTYQSQAKSMPKMPIKHNIHRKGSKSKRKRRNAERENKFMAPSFTSERQRYKKKKNKSSVHVRFNQMHDINTDSDTDMDDEMDTFSMAAFKISSKSDGNLLTNSRNSELKEELGLIKLPNESENIESKNEISSDESDDGLFAYAIQLNKSRTKQRRNSDSIISPTSVRSDSNMTNLDYKRHTIVNTITESPAVVLPLPLPNINDNLSMVTEDQSGFKPLIMDDNFIYNGTRKRRRSAPDTPTIWNDNVMLTIESIQPPPAQISHHRRNKPLTIKIKKKPLPPVNISVLHKHNKDLIDKLLGFKAHLWDFDNE
eukprot:303150_1